MLLTDVSTATKLIQFISIDHQILAELLAHEVKVPQPSAAYQQASATYSSGSSSDEELTTTVELNAERIVEEEAEEEEDFKMKVTATSNMVVSHVCMHIPCSPGHSRSETNGCYWMK